MTDSQTGTYGAVSRANHWIVSLAVFGMLAVGFILSSDVLPREEASSLRNLHKATGTVLLFLFAWRVIWRLRQGFPAPVPGVAAWQITASRLVHWGLLAALILMPLSGVLMSLLGGRPVDIFGLFQIPPVAEIEGAGKLARTVHGYLAWTLVALIALHITAALKHQFVNKDATLARMLTGKTPGA